MSGLLRRREVFALLGGVAASGTLSFASRAQQAGKLPIVAIVGTTSPQTWMLWTAALVRRLNELGWIEGRTVAFEYRWAEGHVERLSAIAAEMTQLKPDVIVTAGTAVPALKQATSVIPIVFALGRDPVGEGLVASLARPGGNVTGLSTQVTDLAGKRLGLLREIVPGVRKIAVVAEVADPGSLRERIEVEAAARSVGLEITPLDLRGPDQDVTPDIEALKTRVDAVYVGTGPLVTLKRSELFTRVLDARLPAIGGLRGYAQAGGLMSYGPDYVDLFRRAGDYADKILRGAKPGDLPIQQPTKFELIINLKTAKALGIEIPSRFLFTADEVIE